MPSLLARFAHLPGYGLAALFVLLAYAAESELRFGERARALHAGPADRMSTLAVSVAAGISVVGFAVTVGRGAAWLAALLPRGLAAVALPGLPATAWCGVGIGACGVALRLWAVLTLRERYTRTLRVQQDHPLERRGPYGWVRHPGYLGSLLCLNGIALASGNWAALLGSLVATSAAYAYRIRVEDGMLVAALGEPYARYRHEVGAILPRFRPPGA